MRTRHINRNGFRFCNHCDKEFSLTHEFFPRDKNRPSGFGYQCHQCAREYGYEKYKKNPRLNRYKNFTKEQKKKKLEIAFRYRQNGGWARHRVPSYRAYDKQKGLLCDLTTKWFLENIMGKPCFYCKRNNQRIGCDRINPSIGHIMTNVVPCCGDCNRTFI